MALALPLLAGFVLAPLLGGRWSLLAKLRIRGVWVFYAAIALQLIAFPVKVLPWHTSDRIGIVLWLVSYGIFSLGIGLNARIPGMPLIGAGLVSNLCAIVANGGHMPALPSALRGAGMHFATGTNRNSAVLHSPHLSWLVDRWAAPSWVPWANVFSVGDVLIMAGGLLFALGATGALRRPWRLATRLQSIDDAIDELELGVRDIATEERPPSERLLRLVKGVELVRGERDEHVCLVPTPGGYNLRACPGAAPVVGTVVDLGGGLWGEVVKVARSPLPNDERSCAYFLPAAASATVEADMPALALVSSGS